MKKYKKNDMTTPMASEPGVAYARLTPEHHATCPETEEFHKGSMPVAWFLTIVNMCTYFTLKVI